MGSPLRKLPLNLKILYITDQAFSSIFSWYGWHMTSYVVFCFFMDLETFDDLVWQVISILQVFNSLQLEKYYKKSKIVWRKALLPGKTTTAFSEENLLTLIVAIFTIQHKLPAENLFWKRKEWVRRGQHRFSIKSWINWVNAPRKTSC